MNTDTVTRKKTAFITGLNGQDASYLAELLLSKNYEVHGIVRRASTINTSRIDHIFDKLHVHYGDMADGSSLARLLSKIQPDEIYNLAAQSHVRVSFEVPEYTGDVGGLGCVRLLEAIRETGLRPRCYQASSSEMFGGVQGVAQNEQTPYYPRSPYACAKVFAHWSTINAREAYGLHASNGILFNHESPRRGETFVTRKITKAVARIKHGLQDKVILGNLDAKRDWGFAQDYVTAMWLMLQQDNPDDYVIATGETHTVREFVERAFARAGISDWQRYVGFDERYLRPTEVDLLLGDASKAKAKLGWTATTTFPELVNLMVDADLEQEGFKKFGP